MLLLTIDLLHNNNNEIFSLIHIKYLHRKFYATAALKVVVITYILFYL